jgi:hypothetical protein
MNKLNLNEATQGNSTDRNSKQLGFSTSEQFLHREQINEIEELMLKLNQGKIWQVNKQLIGRMQSCKSFLENLEAYQDCIQRKSYSNDRPVIYKQLQVLASCLCLPASQEDVDTNTTDELERIPLIEVGLEMVRFMQRIRFASDMQLAPDPSLASWQKKIYGLSLYSLYAEIKNTKLSSLNNTPQKTFNTVPDASLQRGEHPESIIDEANPMKSFLDPVT